MPQMPARRTRSHDRGRSPGLSKVAAYRSESGQLHVRSATCTHAGCVVHWNSFEKCWDCPCHGSHFAPDGTAINGPAVERLAKAP
jgi:Rieske Fe-S protein